MLITPEELKQEIKLSKEEIKQVINHQQQISNILNWKDSRKLIIAWPCSMDFKESIINYWQQLKILQKKYENKALFVMRTYDSKPRTTVWWKWMIQWWEFWSKANINEWLRNSRKIMKEIISLWLPVANELLYPWIYSYQNDILSYIAIGARSSEDQWHRELASAIETPVGVKNPTSWDTQITANSLIASRSEQPIFIPWMPSYSQWNPNSHIILRWANFNWESYPNISDEFINRVNKILQEKWISTKYIIDLNHDNSWKNADLQIENMRISKKLKNFDKIAGFMVESYLFDGNQKADENNLESIEKWKSITDPCISIEKLEVLIKELF